MCIEQTGAACPVRGKVQESAEEGSVKEVARSLFMGKSGRVFLE